MKDIVVIALLWVLCGCSGVDSHPPILDDGFAKGADVSWLTEMEAEGRRFYSGEDVEMDCFALMKELGMNSIRLRVWVDPVDGWCGKEDFMTKARRASKAGLRLMVNFHYSDSWADPGKQNKPKSWANLDFEGLKGAVTEHTNEILVALRSAGVEPEWIQIGNETSDGMLWDDGKASVDMEQYAELNNAGYDAAKAIFPDASVMIHLNNGYDSGLYRWLLGGMKKYGAKWDAVGVSLYPSHSPYPDGSESLGLCIANMKEIISTYNCDVVVAETGMRCDEPNQAKAFLAELLRQSREIERCMGVFYWEPQSYSWRGYGLGAFDSSGRPTVALDAFRD